MAFSALTLTRDDIDAFEGETFRDLNVTASGTTLGLSERDTLVLDKAKLELQTDILERMQTHIADGTYPSETALLDAIYEKDDEELLKNVLCYKFLELWFQQDATNRDSLAFAKATMYYRKYSHYVQINVRRLAGLLATPKQMPRYRMRSTFGY